MPSTKLDDLDGLCDEIIPDIEIDWNLLNSDFVNVVHASGFSSPYDCVVCFILFFFLSRFYPTNFFNKIFNKVDVEFL